MVLASKDKELSVLRKTLYGPLTPNTIDHSFLEEILHNRAYLGRLLSLPEAVAQIEKSLQELRSSLPYDDDIADAFDALEVLGDNVNDFQNKIDNLEDEISSAQEQLERQDDDISVIQQDLESLENKHADSKPEKIKEELSGLVNEFSKLKKDLLEFWTPGSNDNKADLSEVIESRNQIKSSIEYLTQEFHKHRTDTEALKEKFEGLETQFKNLTQELKEQKVVVEDIRGNFEELEKRFKNLTGEVCLEGKGTNDICIEELREELSKQITSNFQTALAKILSLDHKIERAVIPKEVQCAAHDQKVENLSEQLLLLTQEVQKLKEQMNKPDEQEFGWKSGVIVFLSIFLFIVFILHFGNL